MGDKEEVMEINRMKKICIACVTGLPVPPSQGGAVETLVQQIVDENEKEPRFKIVVLTTKEKKSEEMANGYKYTKYVRFRPDLWRNRICFRFVKIMKKIGIKNCYYISSEKKDSAKYLIKNHHKFDIIVDEGGIEEFVYGDATIPFNKRVLHMHGIDAYCVNNAKKVKYVMCVSHFCTKQWISVTGMEKDNVYDLINSINTEHLRRKPSNSDILKIRNSLNIGKNTFVLLYSGRLIEEKGLAELIQALNMIDNENVLLLVLGGVYYSRNYKETPYVKRCRELAGKTKSRVVFLGYVNNDEIYKYHAISDVAVIPSRYEEPACLVVLEAQGAGDAVIATDSGGTPELLGDGCGILIRNDKDVVYRLANAVKEFMDNPELCRKCGDAGVAFSLAHNGKEFFENFCGIIDSVIDRNEKNTSLCRKNIEN